MEEKEERKRKDRGKRKTKEKERERIAHRRKMSATPYISTRSYRADAENKRE